MRKDVLRAIFLLAFSASLTAQKTYRARILDDKYEPVVSVAVVVKGSGVGTLTDEEGYFALAVSDNEEVVASCVGYEPLRVDVIQEDSILYMKSGQWLDAVTITHYGGCRLRCCCSLYSLSTQGTSVITPSYPLSSTHLNNGATHLTFGMRESWLGLRYSGWKKEKIHYRISKSTDDVAYRLIGASRSDAQNHLAVSGSLYQRDWGGAQFVDREVSRAPVTHYLVEGYRVPVAEEDPLETEEIDFSDENRVYCEKISVASADILTITSVSTTEGRVTVQLKTPTIAEMVDVVLVDMSGRVWEKQQLRLTHESAAMVLNVPDLAPGTYVVTARQGVQQDVRKIVLAL